MHLHSGHANSETATAEIDLDVDVSRAWDMLTNDDLLSAWIGDGSRIDPEIGGEALFEDLETGCRRFGTVTEVAPGSRLGFTWWPETDPAEATDVTFEIESTDTGCTIRVNETRSTETPVIASAASTASAKAGAATAWAWRAFALATLTSALVSVR